MRGQTEVKAGPAPLTAAQRELCVAHVGWALWVARWAARRCPHLVEEFECAALAGLVLAARRYDPARHASFRAFALARVRGEIVDQARGLLPLGFRRGRAGAPGMMSLSSRPREPEGHGCARASVGVVDALAADVPAPDAAAEADDGFERLVRLAPERDRALLRAYFGRVPLTFAQIARGIGRSEGGVCRRVARALEQIRAALESERERAWA